MKHDFDGKTYDPAKDRDRLNKQLGRVFQIMSDGEWYTLSDIRLASWRLYRAHDSESGISARIRDLRKARFGNYEVLSRRNDKAISGLWEYQLIIN